MGLTSRSGPRVFQILNGCCGLRVPPVLAYGILSPSCVHPPAFIEHLLGALGACHVIRTQQYPS